MTEHTSKWPFGDTDGGPATRPLIVNLENVLIVMLASTADAERALESMQATGFSDANLRLYSSEQILAYDDTYRSGRGVKERVVGALVDDTDSMSKYVDFARDGCAALWILVADRDDANRVLRHLADHEVVFVWFHGSRGVETIAVPDSP